MKTIAMLLMLIPVLAFGDLPNGTYQLKPTGTVYRPPDQVSCGGANRLLHDRYRVVLGHQGHDWLNGLKWDRVAGFDDGEHIMVTNYFGQVSYGLGMLSIDGLIDGTFVLLGHLPAIKGTVWYPRGQPCEDRIDLVGRKIK